MLNKHNSHARYYIENAFGFLKGHFQLLSYPLLFRFKDLLFTIHLTATFMLYNFLIDPQDKLPEVDEKCVVAAPRVDDVDLRSIDLEI